MRYVFDLERSGRGLRLNRFLHDLVSSDKRKAFLENPEAAMQGLTDEEKDMLRRRDWKAYRSHLADARRHWREALRLMAQITGEAA